jgi:ADP-ribose pyrophosphatase YjhB (NUDIX family)/adenosine deaminase
MANLQIELDCSGENILQVSRLADGRLEFVLLNRLDNRLSPLYRAFRERISIRIGASQMRLLPGQDSFIVDQATEQVRLVLGEDEGFTLATFDLSANAPRLVEHHQLSPIETRFLSDNGFPHPLPSGLVDTFKPLADLHTHFAGCIAAKDLIDIGIKHGVLYEKDHLGSLGIQMNGDGPFAIQELPPRALENLTRSLHVPMDHQLTYGSMQSIYRGRRPITKNQDAFIPLCERIAEDYAEMGIRYAELSLFDITQSKRIAAVHEHFSQIERKTGVRLRFLAAMNRHDDLEWDLDYIDRIKQLVQSPYIVGIDFMGHETNSTRAFLPQIEAVASWAHTARPGFVIRVHAGENPAHPENVRVAAEAVAGYNVQLRIGHGLYGVDERTLAKIAEVNGIVEFNLNSNFALNNIQMTDDAPLRKYLDAGIPVVLATDGYGIYCTSGKHEARAAALAGLTQADFDKIRSTEENYIAERLANDQAVTSESLAIPEEHPPKHYTAQVMERKRSATKERDEALLSRLSDIEVGLYEGDALHDYLDKQVCVNFAGAWRKSWDRISKSNQAEIDDVIDGCLQRLDPSCTVLITGGTRFGVEAAVHRLAAVRGFKVLGAIVDATPPEFLEEEGLAAVTRVSATLYNKAARLYHLLHEHDAFCIFIGGGNIVGDEIQTARNLRMRYGVMRGIEGASGQHATLNPHLSFGTSEELYDLLTSRRWSSSEGKYWHLGANPSVDIVVKRRNAAGDSHELLLIRRAHTAATEAGKWALPGGFQLTDAPSGTQWVPGMETATEACVRELLEETNLDISQQREDLLHIGDFEGGGRDPRDSDEAWSRSQVFAIELSDELATSTVVGSDDAMDARWFDLDALPRNIAFDHDRIISVALDIMARSRIHKSSPQNEPVR